MGSPTLLRRVRSTLALACFTLLFAGAASATEVRQAHDDGAEPVLDVEFSRAAAGAADRRAQRLDRRAQRRAARLRFRSRGRQFELALDENRKLLDGLPAGARARLRARHELFTGELEGQDGSWVRLTRTRGRWQGLVFDGSELLVMEDDAVRGPRLARLLDVPVAGSCGLEPDPEMVEAMSGQALVDELGELTEAGAPPVAFAASGRLDIAVIGDPAFVADHADPEGRALALLNAVDGIYAAQVGVSLRVVELQLLESDAGLTSNDAGTLLTQLRNLTETGAVTNPGLVHLLTGRSLDGSTVGVAYLEVLCNTRWGVGLSEDLSSFGSTVVLVAHEIGHNFGAPHDNQGGSACSGAPGGHIMSPWLDASADSFSACSLDQIALEVAGASCITPIEPEPEPDPDLPACSNGIDDDGDGHIDFGEDLHCRNAQHDSEMPGCNDGLDNDHDGKVDYPEDRNCRGPDQYSEASSSSCGLGFEAAPFVLLWSALRRRRRRRILAS